MGIKIVCFFVLFFISPCACFFTPFEPALNDWVQKMRAEVGGGKGKGKRREKKRKKEKKWGSKSFVFFFVLFFL